MERVDAPRPPLTHFDIEPVAPTNGNGSGILSAGSGAMRSGSGMLAGSSGILVRSQAQRPPSGSTTGTLALLKALRRCWVPALCVGLVLAALAAAATRMILPVGQHTARAQLYVSATAPKVMFNTQENKVEFNNYMKSQMAKMRSRPILKAVLAREDVAALPLIRELNSPLEWLENKLQVDNQTAPELLRVSLSGERPDDLAVIVNAVTQCYLREVVDRETQDREGRVRQLEDITRAKEEQIREIKQRRKTLAEKMGSGDPRALVFREELLAQRLAAPEKELQQVQSELRRYEIEAAALKATGHLEPAILETDIAEALDRDIVIQQLQARVAQAEGAIDRVKQVVERDLSDPIFYRYRSELESAQAALAERRKTARPQIVEQLKQKAKLDAKTNADDLTRRITQHKELEKNLNGEVVRVTKQLDQLAKSATELEGFKDVISEIEELTKKLNLEKEQRLVESQAPPRVAPWEEAVVTQADNAKRRLLASALAGMGTLAFVLFAFAWWELHARRITVVDDVIQGLGMRVLGVLPTWHGRKGLLRPSTLPGRSGAQIPFIEAVDSVRTMIAHSAHVDNLRVLMVTSAVQGEGKTLLSCHLAARLAASGRRTLLIDGDLRKPAVHQLYDLPAKPGLAELLRGEVAPDAVIHTIAEGTLDVIAAGALDGMTSQALAQGRMHVVIEELKDRYDLIVIDSSPVLPVPDALLMGQQADGVIFAVLRDVSRIPKVNAAAEKLEALGIPVLGTVVNGGGGESDGAVYP